MITKIIPLGPKVTETASASTFTPRSICSRAVWPYEITFPLLQRTPPGHEERTEDVSMSNKQRSERGEKKKEKDLKKRMVK